MLTSEQKKTVAEMTNEEKNKKVCDILGIQWHETKLNIDGINYRCSCGSLLYADLAYNHVVNLNPDFTDDAGAVRLLRELEPQEWYLSFMGFAADNLLNEEYFELITTPGLLAGKLIEWKEGKG